MRNIFRFISVIAMVLFLASLPATEADWSKTELDEPLSIDGRINRDGSSFSFQLNEKGIPDEPVRIVAHLRSDIDAETGIPKGESEPLYDPETLVFNPSCDLVYIGAELLDISPDTTIYVDNNQQSTGIGSNIDLIKGATATLNIAYNPSFTHQKGVIWYVADGAKTFSDFEYSGGSSQCTITARNPTFTRGTPARSVTLRALSIYDPWFDTMERMYDTRYGDEDYRVDDWKTKYVAMTDRQHLNGGLSEADEKNLLEKGYSQHDIAEMKAENSRLWSYPDERSVTKGYYTDYQITIREPIETAVFRSEAQTQTNKGSAAIAEYAFINDQLRHPDVTATDEIWCYDTSDASLGSKSVDAFYVSADLVPSYGYTLQYELVEGAGIGQLDFTEIDAVDNAFRFVPHGPKTDAYGNTVTNYGDVVIRATAEDVNFSKLFTLHYLPSNVRMVKYIGDDWENNKWNHGIVLNSDDTVNDALSGEWDIYWADTREKPWENPSSDPSLFGLECLMLYPGESFDLAAVSFVRPDSAADSLKEPFYMADGVPSVDTSVPGGNIVWTDYAITYALYSDADASNPVPGYLEFGSGYAEEKTITDDGFESTVLVHTSRDTGRSDWFYTPDNRITAKEGTAGVFYLSYTISPIGDNGSPSLDDGTMTGGIYVIISEPVDQVLLDTVQQQTYSTIELEIPYAISAGQRKASHRSDGVLFPSHWFLGDKGVCAEDPIVAGDTEGLRPMYRGKAYAAFSRDMDLSQIDGIRQMSRVTYIENMQTVIAGDENDYFEISSSTLSDGMPDILIEPELSDIRLTGEFGLNRFPLIFTLYVKDVNGQLTGANTENSIFDFSSLNVEYYRHEGMSSAGKEIKELKLPRSIVKLELSGNYLNADLTFADSAKRTLEYIDIGNNLFDDVTLDGFTALAIVKAEGSSLRGGTSDGGDRYLNIINTPQLELVEANETQFNYIVASFKNLPFSYYHSDRYVESSADLNYQQGVITAFRADGSDFLYGVNLSGSIGYVELTADKYLESVIHSASVTAGRYDTYAPDSSSEGYHWIKVFNLGGSNSLMDNAKNSNKEMYAGFNPEQEFPSTKAFVNGLPWDLYDTYQHYRSGSNHVKYIKLNRIQRFHSDDAAAKTALTSSQIKSGEISDPVSSLPMLRVNIVDGYNYSRSSGIYDFSFLETSGFSTVTFDSVSENSSVRLDEADVPELYLDNMKGYFSMRNNPSLKSVTVNPSLPSSEVGHSTLDISGSGIVQISSASGSDFKGIALRCSKSFVLDVGDTVTVSADAEPIMYTPELSLSLRSDNPSVASVSGSRISAVSPGTATITVTGRVSGSSTIATEEIRITVNKETVYQTRLDIHEGNGGISDTYTITEDYYLSGFPLSAHLFNRTDNQREEDISAEMFDESLYEEGLVVSDSYKVLWSVSDPSAVIIQSDSLFDNEILVFPQKETGTITLTASYSGITTTCTLKLQGDQFTLELEKESVEFHSEYDDPVILRAYLTDKATGANAESLMTESLRWTISDSSVARIESLNSNATEVRIIPVGKGTAAITASYRADNSEGFSPDIAEGTVSVHGLDIGVSVLSGKVAGDTKSHTAITATLYDSVTHETVTPPQNIFIWDVSMTASPSSSGASGVIVEPSDRSVLNIRSTKKCDFLSFTLRNVSYGNYSYYGSKDIVLETEQHGALIEPVFLSEINEERIIDASRPIDERSMEMHLSHFSAVRSYVETMPSISSRKRTARLASAYEPKLLSTLASSGNNVDARVYKLIVDNCSSLTYIRLSTDSSRLTADVRVLSALNCPKLGEVDVSSSSKLTTIYAYGNRNLTNVNIAASSCTYVDMHNCNIGEGFLKLPGGFSYSQQGVIATIEHVWGSFATHEDDITAVYASEEDLEEARIWHDLIGQTLYYDVYRKETNGVIDNPESISIGSDFIFYGNDIKDCTVFADIQNCTFEKTYMITDRFKIFIRWNPERLGLGGNHCYINYTFPNIDSVSIDKRYGAVIKPQEELYEWTYTASEMGLRAGEKYEFVIKQGWKGRGNDGWNRDRCATVLWVYAYPFGN